jgi:hypothetical protein
VASRPDNERKLPANHQQRRAEYIDVFRQIGAARDALPAFLSLTNGERLYLGSTASVRAALEQLRESFQYASGMGRFSGLADLATAPPRRPVSREDAEQLASDVSQLIDSAGDELRPGARRLLRTLAQLQERLS